MSLWIRKVVIEGMACLNYNLPYLWNNNFFQNTNDFFFWISVLNFFVTSLGLPGSFLRLPRDLLSNIITKESYRKPRKASRNPQGSYKNFQGRNSNNIFVGLLVETMTPKGHFEINWPLASHVLKTELQVWNFCNMVSPLIIFNFVFWKENGKNASTKSMVHQA